ncbi:hypothetical protein [Streptomyces sp. NPDC048361]
MFVIESILSRFWVALLTMGWTAGPPENHRQQQFDGVTGGSGRAAR